MKYGELRKIEHIMTRLMRLIDVASRVTHKYTGVQPQKRPRKSLMPFQRFLRQMLSLPHQEEMSIMHLAMLKRHMIRCSRKLTNGYELVLSAIREHNLRGAEAQEAFRELMKHGILNSLSAQAVQIVNTVDIADLSDATADELAEFEKLRYGMSNLVYEIDILGNKFNAIYFEVMARTSYIDVKTIHPDLADPSLL